MSRPTQIAVLIGLIAVIAAVAAWRIRDALQEAAGQDGRVETNAEWLTHLRVESVDGAMPEHARSLGVIPTDLAFTGAGVHLAHFKWRDRLERLDHFGANSEIPFPIFNKTMELGGNLIVKGAISDADPELEHGQGWIDLDAWFVHTGPVPFSSLPSHHHVLCAVREVPVGSPFKVNDVVVASGSVDLSKQLVTNPCKTVGEAMKPAHDGDTYPVTVIRDGAQITVTAQNLPHNEIIVHPVPVLDADLAK